MAEPAPLSAPRFKRILLKLSGEALMGPGGFGIDPPTLEGIASEVAEVRALGVEVAVVIGGGNIFRGLAASAHGMAGDRVPPRNRLLFVVGRADAG